MLDKMHKDLWHKYLTYNTIIHKIPYVYQINTNKCSILYYGVPHHITYKSENFNDLLKAFLDFRPELLYVEGIPWIDDISILSKFSSIDKKILINNYGENLFFATFANENGIRVCCGDSTLREEFLFCKKNHCSDLDYITFMALKMSINKLSNQDVYSFEKYFDLCDYYMNSELGEYYLPFQKYFCKLMKYLFKKVKVSRIKDFIDPVFRKGKKAFFEGKYNTISRLCNICRDAKLINSILKESKNYRKIMIIYGYTHAYVQEEILRTMCNF